MMNTANTHTFPSLNTVLLGQELRHVFVATRKTYDEALHEAFATDMRGEDYDSFHRKQFIKFYEADVAHESDKTFRNRSTDEANYNLFKRQEATQAA
ncbi:hypothetical protein PspCFBP13528_22350 [Pseudomonas sp. CFBP13528]|uniref:hypothetical protein n=1 Tax=Pseudomonas sp. CFBP13528 TaxID=2184006 RepID=UPI0010BFD803|nr:hypothetical protein [Pseudomonas sp. CFBP13528]TKK27376.1 hypothetical protein PspCFBP13528_22350 [Pseudomonas sp. CFBP13528]